MTAAKKFSWMAVEAYPLFVAVGGASLAAGFQISRWLYACPTARSFKETSRMQCVPEDPKNVVEGRAYYDHAIRRFATAYGGEGGIFKSLNKAMSQP